MKIILDRDKTIEHGSMAIAKCEYKKDKHKQLRYWVGRQVCEGILDHKGFKEPVKFVMGEEGVCLYNTYGQDIDKYVVGFSCKLSDSLVEVEVYGIIPGQKIIKCLKSSVSNTYKILKTDFII